MFDRIQHSGAAVPTTLNGNITSGATSLVLTAATGWPDGSVGPFYLVVDAGLATEEKILATSSTGTTLNSLTRGVDGTSASAHVSGAAIAHIFTAVEADEANQIVNGTLGTVTTKGDTFAATGAGALARLAAGANNTVLQADSAQTTGLKFAKIVAANITAGTITSTEIADGGIDTADLADEAVTSPKIATGTVATSNIANSAITTVLIADANVTPAKLSSDSGAIIVCTSGTRPGSPNQGMKIYETDTGNELTYQGATDTWTPPWNTAWGVIASATDTAGAAHIQGTTLSDLSLANVAMVANRRLFVEAGLRINNSAAAGAVEVVLRRAGSQVYRYDFGTEEGTRTGQGGCPVASIAGSATWTVFVDVSVGAGDLTLLNTQISWFRITDEGPNGAPS